MKEYRISTLLDELGKLILIPEILEEELDQKTVSKLVEETLRIWSEDLEKYQ